jgi:hypothetical protein
MITRSDIFGVACVLAGAGVALYVAERAPVPSTDAARFAGTYVGSAHLTLKPDGSYAAFWSSGCCLDPHGKASGNWRVSGQSLVLSPITETDMPAGYLRTLDIVELDDRTVFVEAGQRASFKKRRAGPTPWFLQGCCFQREDESPTPGSG